LLDHLGAGIIATELVNTIELFSIGKNCLVLVPRLSVAVHSEMGALKK